MKFSIGEYGGAAGHEEKSRNTATSITKTSGATTVSSKTENAATTAENTWPTAITDRTRARNLEMFLQIAIRNEDRVALRFLWRGSDREGSPREYRRRASYLELHHY